jgi:hypothetical protein
MKKFFFLAPVMALLLAACGEKGPDVGKSFESELPKAWQAKSFKITVKEDIGTKVEPRRQFRYEAAVAPNADLYRTVLTFDEVKVVELTQKKGAKATAHGTATAAYVGGQWRTVFDAETAPYHGGGEPVEIGPSAVVVGSKAYKDFVSRLKSEFAGMEGEDERAQEKLRELQEARLEADRKRGERLQELNVQLQETSATANAKQQEARKIFLAERDKIRGELDSEWHKREVELNEAFKALSKTFGSTPDDLAQRKQAGEQLDKDRRALGAEIAERREKGFARIQEAYNAVEVAARAEIEAVSKARNDLYRGADPEGQRIQNAIQTLYNEQQQRAQRAQELTFVINELDKPQTLDQ